MLHRKGIEERLKILKGKRSLKEFARLIGIPVSTLHYYLKGREPSISFLQMVCTRLAIREEWLLLGKGPIHKRDAESEKDTYIDIILTFLKEKWAYLTEKERHWLEVEIMRMFPDFMEWLSFRSDR